MYICEIGLNISFLWMSSLGFGFKVRWSHKMNWELSPIFVFFWKNLWKSIVSPSCFIEYVGKTICAYNRRKVLNYIFKFFNSYKTVQLFQFFCENVRYILNEFFHFIYIVNLLATYVGKKKCYAFNISSFLTFGNLCLGQTEGVSIL